MKSEALEDTAQRIAEKGRAALSHRLREAFEEAATAHADVLHLAPNKVEQMIERAVDLADGLQWRRALAVAATDELGIGLGEALGHPAVARAQKLVGAPSYEEALAAVAEGKPPAPGRRAREVEDESASGEQAPAGPTPEEFDVMVSVVHLDGLPELEGEGELELQFSEDGVKVIRAGDRAALVRFAWSDLDGIGVHPRRGRMWRRHAARVILSTNGKHGRFDAPDCEPEELKRRLAPAVAKLGASG